MKDNTKPGRVARVNGNGGGLWLPPGVAPSKPKRNDPCPCGSGKKYKKCCDAPPSQERPPCSVKDCEEPVKFFLSPSVDGERSDSHYWVACEGHVQDISASAAAVGMDVTVIPFDSLEGMTIAPDGLDPVDVVQEQIEPAPEPEPEAGNDAGP